VADAFRRIAAGETTRAVVERLAKLPDDERGGFRVTRRTLQDALRNPIYAALRPRLPDGTMQEHGPRASELAPVRWPAIVDCTTWEQVQRRLDSRRESKARGNFLLTGLLYCPVCGGRMHGETLPAGVASPRYRCGGDDRSTCHQTANRDAVDKLVLEEVGVLIEATTSSDARMQRALRRAWAALDQPNDSHARARAMRRLEQQATTARARVTKATEMFVDGAIDRAAYDALLDKARTDLNSAEAELATLRIDTPSVLTLPTLDEALRLAGSWSAALGHSDLTAQRDVLALIVQRITPRRVKRGIYQVDIAWTPLGQTLRSTMGQSEQAA
jgi:hypothetical protein